MMKMRHTFSTAVLAAACLLLAPYAAADQVILDDLIVDGSACIGFDCVNGESFGFDTIRLKENNLRIKFEDTSSASGFPTRDWQITANDSANGGADKFSIDDVSAGRTPFTIEGAAPSHSLYVDDGGRVGLHTSTPVVELHVKDGDSPTLRLEQDGSSGFTPQTWDVAGNETNFFVRDVTNGSLLPFRIRPSAPTNNIYIDTDGNVGMGTASPQAGLDVQGQFLIEDAAVNVGIFRTTGAGAATMQVDAMNGDDSWQFGVRANDTFIITPTGTIGAPVFVIDTSGNVTIPGGAMYNGSDRNTKRDFKSVHSSEVLAKIAELPISTWNRKTEDPSIRHIGPMAQDFYSVFGLGRDERTISTLDLAGVSLAAIKALHEKLQQKETEIAEAQQRNKQLAERLDRMEGLFFNAQARLARMEALLGVEEGETFAEKKTMTK